MKLYHGTSQAEWENIQKVGLIPQGGKGADSWLETSDNFEAILMRLGGVAFDHPKPGIYLSPLKSRAHKYALLAAEMNSSTPVILEVSALKKDLTLDPADEAFHSYISFSPIPPEKIKLATKAKGA